MFGGSLLLYHPLLNYREYKQTDEAFKETCCGAADMCDFFYERRPANNCTGYQPPVRSKIIIYFKMYYSCRYWLQAWGWGDPHVTTLDGRSYTFNGWGEYVLLEYVPEGATQPTFTLQGRTTPVSNESSATKYSAFALGLQNSSSVMVGLSNYSSLL